MTDQIELIALDRIDDPDAPMRSKMDEEKLAELAASIREQGLIQPVTLRKVADRYEVVAGHRRTKAARLAGLALIPAIVRDVDDKKMDELRVHENLYREDVNSVDEARYIRRMVDVHGADPADLSRMLGKSEAYLRARYDLLDYPDYLIQAVELDLVTLTAAQWLSKIEDDNVRKEYTRFAMLGGITAKRAEAWYRSWQLGSLPREAHMFVAQPTETSAEPVKLYMPCVLCQHQDELDKLQMVYAHPECAKAVREMQKSDGTVQSESTAVL